MSKNPKEWIEEILDKKPNYTPREIWDATHRKLELSYIEEYMAEKNEENKQEGIEREDIADIGHRAVSSRKSKRNI